MEGSCQFAQITSAKVCSVFLKYQIPDATSTITSITAIAEPGPVNIVSRAQQAPAETIDDSHHRIERVEQAKAFWNDAALETDRRDVKAKLDHERNNETEIAILHHEGGNPQTDARERRRMPAAQKTAERTRPQEARSGTRSSEQQGRQPEIRKSTKLVMTLLTMMTSRGK